MQMKNKLGIFVCKKCGYKKCVNEEYIGNNAKCLNCGEICKIVDHMSAEKVKLRIHCANCGLEKTSYGSFCYHGKTVHCPSCKSIVDVKYIENFEKKRMFNNKNKEKDDMPNTVIFALLILYATLATEFIYNIGSNSSFDRLINIISSMIQLYILHMIGKRRNWARILLLGFFIFGLIISLINFSELSAAYIFMIIVETIALILLFYKKSSKWFRNNN